MAEQPLAPTPPPPDASNGHEALCSRCGKCCYKKIIVGRAVFITPFPCEFLDTAANACTVYERRHELNPHCLSVPNGMLVSAFPADCGYVAEQAPEGYRPALDTWSWDGQWGDFDGLADDLDVSDETREKIRARGPWAPPLWVEANERIARERAAAGVAPPTAPPIARPARAVGLDAEDGILWGRPGKVFNLARTPPAEGPVPKLCALLKGRKDGP